jgi:hypothetical protein
MDNNTLQESNNRLLWPQYKRYEDSKEHDIFIEAVM